MNDDLAFISSHPFRGHYLQGNQKPEDAGKTIKQAGEIGKRF
jgi:hypothetical protein